MGVIRPSATGSGIDIGELTAIGGAATPLGDAAPLELGDMPSFGNSFDIAKTPNNGEPGTWYTNPGSGQMRLYGNDGKGYIDLDFDHKHDGLNPTRTTTTVVIAIGLLRRFRSCLTRVNYAYK
jgi:hypothetical protein